MNDFFTENFNISKIIVCTHVHPGNGGLVHRNRQSHGLVIQLSGVKEYKFATGETLITYPGQVFYLPKFSDYDVKSVENGDCIAVNYELSDENITYPPFVCSDKKSAFLTNCFKKLLKAWQGKKVGYMNVCFRYLYEIISEVQAENNHVYLPNERTILVDRGTEIINNNLDNCSLTVAGVATELGISPEYFRVLFKGVYNMSPRKYIINQRISKAIELMSLNEFKLNEIAELCGFNDATYFSTEFKKATGYAPKGYMKYFFG